jgi:hypothetical protein
MIVSYVRYDWNTTTAGTLRRNGKSLAKLSEPPISALACNHCDAKHQAATGSARSVCWISLQWLSREPMV